MSIRYHAVTLAAVLFALAAGIALGAGVLGGDRGSDDAGTGESTTPSDDLAAFEIGFAESVTPDLVGSTLDDADVLVAEVPGASREGTDAVIASLEQADANVVGNIAITERLIDPAERQFADGVATNALEEVEDADDAENPYGRVGNALSRALVDVDAESLDADADAIMAAFTSGELIEVRGDLDQGADTVVVVGGDEVPSNGQASVIAEIAAVMADNGADVVVAGPAVQSAEGGIVTAVAESEASATVSTFDVLDSPLGVASLPLIVANEADGNTGAYGTERAADGVLPDLS